MIVLNFKDPRPISEQVVCRFEELILRGIMTEGEAMPSVRSLAMELSINPNTIQKAYQELERRGIIDIVKGKGSYVASVERLKQNKQAAFYSQFEKSLEEAAILGISEEELIEAIRKFNMGRKIDD